MIFLAKIFEPSMRAAPREGPKIFKPASQKASAIPPTSGASGPTMVRSMSTVLAKLRNEIRSSTGMSTSSATEAIPGLPGAAKISSACRLCDRASTSACSRPPLPTTSKRTALSPCPLDYGLVPLRTNADHAQGHLKLVLDKPHEILRLLGQILPPPATSYIYAPAGK